MTSWGGVNTKFILSTINRQPQGPEVVFSRTGNINIEKGASKNQNGQKIEQNVVFLVFSAIFDSSMSNIQVWPDQSRRK